MIVKKKIYSLIRLGINALCPFAYQLQRVH